MTSFWDFFSLIFTLPLFELYGLDVWRILRHFALHSNSTHSFPVRFVQVVHYLIRFHFLSFFLWPPSYWNLFQILMDWFGVIKDIRGLCSRSFENYRQHYRSVFDVWPLSNVAGSYLIKAARSSGTTPWFHRRRQITSKVTPIIAQFDCFKCFHFSHLFLLMNWTNRAENGCFECQTSKNWWIALQESDPWRVSSFGSSRMNQSSTNYLNPSGH